MSSSILCVPSATLDRPAGYAPLPEDPDWPLGPWVLPEPTWLPRTDALESDPSWKQVIPYVLCVRDGRVLAYRRPRKGPGEARLAGRWSIGVGGHVEQDDAWESPPETVLRAAWREIEEELRPVDPGACLAWWAVGTIVDPTSAVGRCHVGVAMVAMFRRGAECRFTAEVMEPRWCDLEEAKGLAAEGKMETWSVIFLDGLIRSGLARTLHLAGRLVGT